MVDLDAVLHLQPVEQHLQVRLAHRPHHDLVGVGVDLDAQRRVLRREPAQAPARACPRRRWCAAVSAVGSSGSGITQGSISAGAAGSDSVSPVSARVSRATATMSPATPESTGVSVPPSTAEMAPTRSSTSWSSWPRSSAGEPGEVAGHVHGGVGHQGPREDPHDADPADVRVRRRLRPPRPPAGRRGRTSSGSRGSPSGVVTAGAGCSNGEGNPRTTTSSSSAVAEPGERVGGQHRVERAAGHRLLEVVDERVERDLLAREPAVEQAVVLGLLDDPLDQPLPGSLDELQVLGVGVPLHPGAAGVVEDLLRQQADQARPAPPRR